MTVPDENRKDPKTDYSEETCKKCKYVRNGIIFATVAFAAGVGIYYLIKENRRVTRLEREMLDFEIWG